MSPPHPAPEQTAGADEARWFAAEVQPLEPALRAYLHRRFPEISDPDDLVQESYVRLLQARQKRPIQSVKNYLFGISRKVAYTLFRKKSVRREIAVADLAVFGDLPDDADTIATVQAHSELEVVLAALGELPPRCREIMVLWATEGLKSDEIAVRLGLSEHTVRVQLARGVKKCIGIMAARGILEETK